MTAQPGDSGHELRAPTSWRSVAAVTAWVVYFCSLLVVYLIAFHRDDHGSQVAAAWGMGISLGVALLSLAAIQVQSPRLRAGASSDRAQLIVGCSLVVGASVAVIWVAINLTLAREPAGAWTLSLPASAAPIALFINRSATARWQARAHPEIALAPIEPGTAEFEPTDTTADGAAVQVLDEGARQGEAVAMTPPGGVLIAPGDALVEVGKPPRLLVADWAARLGAAPVSIALDASFWKAAVNILAKQPHEQGGVAFVARSNGVTLVLGVVFPEQIHASPVRCEFSPTDVDRVRRALDDVAAELGNANSEIALTWVHTHPGLSVFLSATDKTTAKDWRALDPNFTPIVIDASKKVLEEQVGVYRSGHNKILPIGLIEGLVNAPATAQLKAAVLRTYQADGLPEPMVLLPAMGNDKRVCYK